MKIKTNLSLFYHEDKLTVFLNYYLWEQGNTKNRYKTLNTEKAFNNHTHLLEAGVANKEKRKEQLYLG